MDNTIKPFKTLTYTTTDGETITAIRKNNIVTIYGNVHGVRQMGMEDFKKEFAATTLHLEKTPKQDTYASQKGPNLIGKISLIAMTGAAVAFGITKGFGKIQKFFSKASNKAGENIANTVNSATKNSNNIPLLTYQPRPEKLVFDKNEYLTPFLRRAVADIQEKTKNIPKLIYQPRVEAPKVPTLEKNHINKNFLTDSENEFVRNFAKIATAHLTKAAYSSPEEEIFKIIKNISNDKSDAAIRKLYKDITKTEYQNNRYKPCTAIKNIITRLDNIFDNVKPLEDDLTVHARAVIGFVDTPAKRHFSNVVRYCKVGDVITPSVGYTQAGIVESAAKRNYATLKIRIPKGSQVVTFENGSCILPRNAQFKVVQKEPAHNLGLKLTLDLVQ